MKHFDPNTFLTDISHNLNNVNPEANEVNCNVSILVLTSRWLSTRSQYS